MHNTECLRCEEGLLQIQRRELVRRSDVKEVIQEKISEAYQKADEAEIPEEDTLYVREDAKEEILKELLEEVEGEASK